MPFITTQRIAEIREELKKEFPCWKFSVTRHHHSTVRVAIIAAPVNLISNETGKDYESVNVYHIASHYKDEPEKRDILLEICSIMDNGNRIVSEDGDYGSIPAFYTDLTIGKYDKPFQFIEVSEVKEQAQEPQEASKIEGKVNIEIVDYSDKAFAIRGETYPIRETLSKLRGKFIKYLKDKDTGTTFSGWIFPKTRYEEVRAFFSNPAKS